MDANNTIITVGEALRITDDLDETGSEREWLFAVDECGTKGTTYYGFGAIVMKSDRRGDFARVFRALLEKHGITSEVKWNRVNRRTLAFMKDLITWFFRTRWISFHAIVVKKADIDKALSQGSYEIAWMKFLTLFVSNKCKRLTDRAKGGRVDVRVWVDTIQSPYGKADEQLKTIATNMLKQDIGDRCPINVRTRDSREVGAIQLCDVFIGAIVTSFLRNAQGEAKLELQSFIAKHLGWDDLLAGTFAWQRKFNVWVFHDSVGEREWKAREVKPLYPWTTDDEAKADPTSNKGPM